MSDQKERACALCGSLLHHEYDCRDYTTRSELQSQLAALKLENEKLVYDKQQLVAEANRRDEKWMTGINEVLGEKLDYDDPCAHNCASVALQKWAKKHRDANEKLVELVRKLSARMAHRSDCDFAKRRRFGRPLPCNCDLLELRAEIERVKGGK